MLSGVSLRVKQYLSDAEADSSQSASPRFMHRGSGTLAARMKKLGLRRPS